jgi:hypothetical protein
MTRLTGCWTGLSPLQSSPPTLFGWTPAFAAGAAGAALAVAVLSPAISVTTTELVKLSV